MTIALIDGDMVAYMAATLAQEEAFPPLPGQDPDDGAPTANWKNCRRIMNDILDKWEYCARATGCMIAMTDRTTSRASFRYHVHPHYKNQRTAAKPMLLERAEEFLRKRKGARFTRGLEGDDVLGIWATGEFAGEGVIVSKDKDMRTIPGRCVIIPHMKSTDGLEIEEISRAQAQDNLFRQVITGDSTDNYLGAPGIGTKGAETWLAASKEDGLTRWGGLIQAYEWAWEMRPRWHDRWVHPGKPYEEALMNMRCARILHDGDYKDGKVRLWGPKGSEEWLSL